MGWRPTLLACLALLVTLQAAAVHAKLTIIAYQLADNDLQCDMYNNLVVSRAAVLLLVLETCSLHAWQASQCRSRYTMGQAAPSTSFRTPKKSLRICYVGHSPAD